MWYQVDLQHNPRYSGWAGYVWSTSDQQAAIQYANRLAANGCQYTVSAIEGPRLEVIHITPRCGAIDCRYCLS